MLKNKWGRFAFFFMYINMTNNKKIEKHQCVLTSKKILSLLLIYFIPLRKSSGSRRI